MRPSVRGGDRRTALAPRGQLVQERGEIAVGRALDGQPAAVQVGAELLQVGAVGLERVAREPALELEVGEEVGDEALRRGPARDALRDRAASRLRAERRERRLGGPPRQLRSAGQPSLGCNQAFRRRASQ